MFTRKPSASIMELLFYFRRYGENKSHIVKYFTLPIFHLVCFITDFSMRFLCPIAFRLCCVYGDIDRGKVKG